MDSRIETLIKALLNGKTVENYEPQSRAEAYLLAAINKSGTGSLPEPQSRLDALLYELVDEIMAGGGSELLLQAKTVSPSVSAKTVYPDSGYALSKVTVEGVTSDIDENIKAENILNGISILGVSGTDKGAFTTTKQFVEGSVPTTFELPYGITKTKMQCFTYLYGLKELVIPETVTTIANGLARNCTALTRVEFKGGQIATLGSHTFADCTKLTTVIFGCEITSSTTIITSSAFTNDTALEEVTFTQSELSGHIYLHQTPVFKKQSAYAIIRKLVNQMGTDNEYDYDVKFHANVWTTIDDTTADDYEAPPSGDTWVDYVISLGYNT